VGFKVERGFLPSRANGVDKVVNEFWAVSH
jgi:hypothetical protein